MADLHDLLCILCLPSLCTSTCSERDLQIHEQRFTISCWYGIIYYLSPGHPELTTLHVYMSHSLALLYVYICVHVRSFGRNHIHYIVACETASHAC